MLAMISKIPEDGAFQMQGQVHAFHKEMMPRLAFHHCIVPRLLSERRAPFLPLFSFPPQTLRREVCVSPVKPDAVLQYIACIYYQTYLHT